MADVFISFSHKDEEFVRRLFDVLQEREVDAWVDWQDIPPSTYFNGEILPAIDAALAMVIVISPGYLKSQVCRWELDHALRNQKRLITVLAATTEPSLLPPPLGEIHWISFVDDVGLQDDGNVERLVNVIRSDFAWIRNHSRILVRAREWSEKNRHRSFLLYGQDLSEAEHWLATKHNGREQATDIHREYIRCSRVWAAWRKRATVVVAAFVIVCLPIMYFGYSLYKSRQRQILAQDLGLEAAMLLPQEDGARRALLLAAESLKMYPTLEANAAILNAISVSPIQLMSLPGSRQPCALSEDGEVLATVGQDGE